MSTGNQGNVARNTDAAPLVAVLDNTGSGAARAAVHNGQDAAHADRADMAERLLAVEQRAREHAERANRMRDDLLAVVAHDLRNPLHTLQLSAMAMAEPGMTDAKRAEQAELIHRLIDGMDRLIGELIDIGRLENGEFPISKSCVALGEVLDEAVTMFRAQADEHGILLECDDGSTDTLMCDRTQIMRVFSNLIGNAVKFTPAGGRVMIRTARTDGTIRVEVCDTGPGMPPDDLRHVFDRFWQADRTRRFGSGLGLVIAKGIVESHGGSITAESTVGRGSCFRFTLPLE